MITWERRVIIADETLRAQAMNHMPGIQNCEDFERHIEFLAKHKDEINERRMRAVVRARKICEASIAYEKPLTMKEMENVLGVIGFTIGRNDEDSVALRDSAERSISVYKRKPTKKTWLDYVKWNKCAGRVMRIIAGARREEMKLKEDK